MTEQSHDISTVSTKELANKTDHKTKFRKKILKFNVLACHNIDRDDFDMNELTQMAEGDFKALAAAGGLQEMLVAQLLSIHHLQQRSMAIAHAATTIENSQYFTNAAVKLANCFTQQANLLNRLQGNGGQRIIVEHVEVHDGGQAIVGVVTPTSSKKK